MRRKLYINDRRVLRQRPRGKIKERRQIQWNQDQGDGPRSYEPCAQENARES